MSQPVAAGFAGRIVQKGRERFSKKAQRFHHFIISIIFNFRVTPWKIHVEPKYGGLEDDFPLIIGGDF